MRTLSGGALILVAVCGSLLAGSARALTLPPQAHVQRLSTADQTTPLPPCVDGQYAPGTAGSGCAVRGDTTPTARCRDGSFDYSRSFNACSGGGGVLVWIGNPTSSPQPGFVGLPVASSTPAPSTNSTTTGPTGASSSPATSTADSSPAPAGAGLVTFSQVTGAAPGGTALATIQAPIAAQCSLSFYTPSGDDSNATDLQGTTTVDASGHATFSWTVDVSTARGSGQLIAVCTPGGSATTPITIG